MRRDDPRVYKVLVTYSWSGGSDTITGNCGETTVSLAPLGTTAHPLRWRFCILDGRDLIQGLHCQPFKDDFVYTD